MSQFKETFKLFNEYVNTFTTERPLSYNTWVELPESFKVAALYVNFYDQITLAWNKVYTKAAIEEDCVSEVIRYLDKNVKLINADASRYSSGYIYRIAYNCLYCKSIDPYKGQTANTSWFNNCCSPYIVSSNGDELCLFDTIVDDVDRIASDIDSSKIHSIFNDEFWSKIFGEPNIVKHVKEVSRNDSNGRVLNNTEVYFEEKYIGGMNNTVQAIVRYLLGEQKTLTQKQQAMMPEVISMLRNMIEDKVTASDLAEFNINIDVNVGL